MIKEEAYMSNNLHIQYEQQNVSLTIILTHKTLPPATGKLSPQKYGLEHYCILGNAIFHQLCVLYLKPRHTWNNFLVQKLLQLLG